MARTDIAKMARIVEKMTMDADILVDEPRDAHKTLIRKELIYLAEFTNLLGDYVYKLESANSTNGYVNRRTEVSLALADTAVALKGAARGRVVRVRT